jgi:hypothetical protein
MGNSWVGGVGWHHISGVSKWREGLGREAKHLLADRL